MAQRASLGDMCRESPTGSWFQHGAPWREGWQEEDDSAVKLFLGESENVSKVHRQGAAFESARRDPRSYDSLNKIAI